MNPSVNPPISRVEKNFKTIYVREGNKNYYPKTIPRERKSMTLTYAIALSFLFLGHYFYSQNLTTLLGLYSVIILLYFAICLLDRFMLFWRELPHCCSRYENITSRILIAAFDFKKKIIFLLVICSGYLIYYYARYGLPSTQDPGWIITIPFLFVLHKLMDLDNFPLNDSLNIAKNNGLNYGSGMAYSFFYGYLKYMLEKIGEPNKSLKEMMEDYEAKNGISFSVYKIFILIPKTLTCFESIQNVSRIMEMRSTLPEKRITVAGVRDRIYKNSVYTINYLEERPVYVCVEYATPLKTFREVFNYSTTHGEYYNRHKNDILLQFYLTLKQILERNGMQHMCELIYYEDMDGQDYHDVGRLLLTKILEIKRNERPHEN